MFFEVGGRFYFIRYSHRISAALTAYGTFMVYKILLLLCCIAAYGFIHFILRYRLYCNVPYCPVLQLYYTVLNCTVLYCTVLYSTILYCPELYCTVLYCTVLYCTVLNCTVLYCGLNILHTDLKQLFIT